MSNRPIRVFVGILAVDGTINLSLGRLLFDLPYMTADQSHRYAFVPWIEGGTRPQEFARNTIIGKAFEAGFDILLMIDDDMIYHGSKTIIQLLDTPDCEIAGPLQLMFRPDTAYGPRIYPVAMNLDKSKPTGKQAHVVMPVPGVAHTKVDTVGSGVIAIRRKVLENEKMLLAPDMDPPAYFRNVYEPNGHRIRGLDVDFCKRAGELGYRIKVNWQSTTGHYKRVDLYELETYAKAQWLEGYELGKKGNGDAVRVDKEEMRPACGPEASARPRPGDNGVAGAGLDQAGGETETPEAPRVAVV